MKLSEAIRKGSALRPQAFLSYADYRARWRFGPLFVTVNATCALGAALHSELGSYAFKKFLLNEDDETFPVNWSDTLHYVPLACPQCHRLHKMLADNGYKTGRHPSGANLEEIIPHLNDDHKWSRECIADYVETIELEIERKRLADATRSFPIVEIEDVHELETV